MNITQVDITPIDSGAWVVAAFVGAFIGLLFAVAAYVVTSWFLMKIFDKAGVQGRWRAWVPVYNYMVFSKLGDLSPWLVLIGFGAAILLSWTGIGWLFSLAAYIVLALAAWRVGLKLQKEAVWVVLFVLLSPVWLGILAFDRSRWNTAIPAAPWAANGFFADRTVWAGVPSQVPLGGYPANPVTQVGYPPAPGAYPPPAGYQAPPPGYQPPPPGYQVPPAGYQAPPPGYQPPPAYPPAAPPQGYAAPPAATPPGPAAPTPPAPSADYRSPAAWDAAAAAAAASVPAAAPPVVPEPAAAEPALPETPAATAAEDAVESAATDAAAAADAVEDAAAEASADHVDDGPVIDFGSPPADDKA